MGCSYTSSLAVSHDHHFSPSQAQSVTLSAQLTLHGSSSSNERQFVASTEPSILLHPRVGMSAWKRSGRGVVVFGRLALECRTDYCQDDCPPSTAHMSSTVSKALGIANGDEFWVVPAAPTRSATSWLTSDRSLRLAKVLVVPIVVAALSFAGVQVASLFAAAQEERARQDARIAEVNRLAGIRVSQSFGVLAASLLPYRASAIPMLSALLREEDDNLRFSAEDGLIQLARLYDLRDKVGESMLLVLDDRVGRYDYRVHFSALRVLAVIRYPGAARSFEHYDPRQAVPDWEAFVGNRENFKKQFLEMVETARAASQPLPSGAPRGQS